MNTTKNTRRHVPLLIVFLLSATFFSACSSAPVKEDTVQQEIQKSAIQQASEETGLSEAALMSFQKAMDEVGKEGGDIDLAIAELEAAVTAEPTFAEAHYNLGLLYAETQRLELSVEHIQKAREIDPDVFDYTIALAQAYAVNEQYTDAEQLFSEVLARDEENLTAKNNMAVIALKRGDDERSMEFVREILREDIANVGALNTLGLIYFKRGNLSLSKYVLEKALRIEEKNTDVLNNLGLVFMKEENVPGAVNAFRRAITADENYLESRLNLGAILIGYLDYERADEHFSAAVRIAPHHCVANLGKGATAFATKEYAESEERYKYYVDRCDTEHLSSYERLAKLNESYLDNPAEAIVYYNKLVGLNKDTAKQQEYKAMVNFLESQMKSSKQKQPEPSEESAPEAGAEEASKN